MNTSISVPFHGNTLFLVEHNGEAYTPMKPIVEGMGLAWQAQHRKIVQRFGTCITEMVMQLPGDSQNRSVICIALRKLTGWLYTVSPNKVKQELREKIVQYQAECDDVLWEYWNRGHAANPRYRPEQTRTTHAGGLTLEQQDAIKAHHKALVQTAPKESQAKLAISLWSSIKSKFGVSYKDVPSSDFIDVISLMSRVALNVGPQQPLLPSPEELLTRKLRDELARWEDGRDRNGMPFDDVTAHNVINGEIHLWRELERITGYEFADYVAWLDALQRYVSYLVDHHRHARLYLGETAKYLESARNLLQPTKQMTVTVGAPMKA